MGSHKPVVVLDDDPTGTQAVADVPVLLRWTPERIAQAVNAGGGAVHLMTNSRALAPAQARTRVAEAAAATFAALPDPLVVLRGDSTLRAHLLEEYEGLRDARSDGGSPVLLLVPALPHAGRTTVGGVHFLERAGQRIPLHATEYARDGGFAYRDARLLQWAEDRSGGFFARAHGREVAPAAVGDALLELSAAPAPAVCVPDVASNVDLAEVRDGLLTALEAGADIIVRAGPAFAALLSGRAATSLVHAPRASSGVLVICGSHVPTTTRQLAVLAATRRDAFVDVDLDAMTSLDAEDEIERSTRAARAALDRSRLAVVATPRDPRALSPDDGARLALNLASVAGRLADRADVVIAKGGITSDVTLRDGIGADSAHVVGPVADGVALWRVERPDGGALAYLVVPGNVGDDDLLARLVDAVLEAQC
jgi:uncharacterized protein YgbK (DUF1537 family)